LGGAGFEGVLLGIVGWAVVLQGFVCYNDWLFNFCTIFLLAKCFIFFSFAK
jgi:hypothetical protein